MAKYPMAGHSYIEVDDAGGMPRNLSPYVAEIEPLGQAVAWVDVTGLKDAAQRTGVGPELAQEFALYGFFDDTPVTGPDAALAGIVGRIGTVSYGPAGGRKGQRKISGEFLCLSYQVFGRIEGPVRFQARFRQTGPAVFGVWD